MSTSMAYPMNKNVQELKVNMTEDLNIFTFLKGNRPPNPQHIKRLAASIKRYGMLINPILVNERYEIIDGQHRYLAAKETNAPIYYIIVSGYALEQVHTLNMNQKNWTAKEFLHGYANMGLKDYIILRDFWHKHSWMTLSNAIALCSNTLTSHNYTQSLIIRENGRVDNRKKDFKAGTWKAGNMQLAETNALKIKTIEPFFPDGYNDSGFISTMLTLFKNENFNHDNFIQKLKLQRTALTKCATREQYKLLIEDIYNYKSRNKVNLRY